MQSKVLRKLRNKFLIFMMVGFSGITILAISIIYLSTYHNTQQENQAKLDSWEAFEDKGFLTVEVDAKGEILQANSKEKIVEELVSLALNQTTDELTIEDQVWIYAIRVSSGVITQSPDDESLISKHVDDKTFEILERDQSAVQNHYLIFLNVTESSEKLSGLLKNFVSVGTLMLIGIFIVSFFVANRVIKPIAKSWNNQKRFIADASHELKTPLTIIKSNYGVLLDNKKESIESQMEWLEYMEFGFERMEHLVNDLLVLARLDNADLGIKSEAFNISQVVEEVIQSMEARIIQKGIQLTKTIEPGIILNSDLEKITQVVIILIDNAIKYTNKDGWIEVAVTKSRRYVTCQVKNSGVGIAKEDLPKIFDRFYRADLSRKSEDKSYGLGLSIAKFIIEKLGGKISASSIENEVTTFSFTLK